MPCRLCNDSGTYRGITRKLQLCGCPVALALIEKRRPRCNRPMRAKPYRIAFAVRKNVEAYSAKIGGKLNLKDFCGLASASLVFALQANDYRAQLVEGVYPGSLHCWVVCGDSIIDITFTQFEKDAPRVYVTAADDLRYCAFATYHDIKFAMNHCRWLAKANPLVRKLAKTEFSKKKEPPKK
jgi:hypothetical protein